MREILVLEILRVAMSSVRRVYVILTNKCLRPPTDSRSGHLPASPSRQCRVSRVYLHCSVHGLRRLVFLVRTPGAANARNYAASLLY